MSNTPTAQQLLGCPDAQVGRELWDVVKQPEILKTVSEVSLTAQRKTVTQTSGFFSRNSATDASASTMSRSIAVFGGWGLPIDSVKNAGSSWFAP